MGTYRQPGIYVHKGYEQFNKAMAQGAQNFLTTYAAAQKQKTANAKANAKALADAKKDYDKWGDIVVDAKKFARDEGVTFDKDLMKMIDGWGQEFYELLGVNTKEAQDRITQLKAYPDQVAHMLASGKVIGEQYGNSFNIPTGKGSIDQKRTSADNLSFAANIYSNGGNRITPVEELDANGKPTGNMLARYTDPGDPANNIAARSFDVNTNELYAQLTDDKSPFQFIYTKGDLKETLNPYLDLAKGETKVNDKGSQTKGDRWYNTASKENEVISYEAVDPSDPNYNAERPYIERTTVTTGYQNDQNLSALGSSLETVSLTQLMGTDGASWIFDDVIDWARTNYANNPEFGEGGRDGDVSTVDDNLFTVDSNGDLVSIPWIADPTSQTSAYANLDEYKNVSKIQHEIFNKYAKEYMLDPANGMIPEDVSRVKKEKYITTKDFNKKSTASRGRGGGGYTPTVKAQIAYGNTPSKALKDNRYPGKNLTPYQYDIAKAEDIVYKLIPGKTGADGIDVNSPNSVDIVRDNLVKQLNDGHMSGMSYKTNRKNYPKFLTPDAAVKALQKKKVQIANAGGDVSAVDAAITKYKTLGPNQYVKSEGGLDVLTITDSDTDSMFKYVKDKIHEYNGLYDATQAFESKFNK